MFTYLRIHTYVSVRVSALYNMYPLYTLDDEKQVPIPLPNADSPFKIRKKYAHPPRGLAGFTVL